MQVSVRPVIRGSIGRCYKPGFRFGGRRWNWTSKGLNPTSREYPLARDRACCRRRFGVDTRPRVLVAVREHSFFGRICGITIVRSERSRWRRSAARLDIQDRLRALRRSSLFRVLAKRGTCAASPGAIQ